MMSVRISNTSSDASPLSSAGKGRPPQPPPPHATPLAERLWDLLQPLARLWGIVTAIVMSGAGAELAVIGYDFAPGMIAGAALVLMLETMWAAALFVDLLGRRGEYTPALRCWDVTRWLCGRARAPFYACAATALLLTNITLLCTVSGAMLVVLALLRAAVPFSPHATHGPHSPRAGSSLLSQLDTPDVFYNANNACSDDNDRAEEMTMLQVTRQHSRSVSPACAPTPAHTTPTPPPAVLLDL